jgi:hypothetical protein
MHAVLGAAENRIRAELDGLDAELSQVHPADKSHRWSVQQIVEHLILSCRETSKKLESRLQKGSVSRKAGRTPTQWALQLMVLTLGHHPVGVPALAETIPPVGPSLQANGDLLTQQLNLEMEAMDKLLERCRSKFGMERVASHPIFGSLRVDQWRRYHALHVLHHAEQIRRTRRAVEPQPIVESANTQRLRKELQIPAQRSAT